MEEFYKTFNIPTVFTGMDKYNDYYSYETYQEAMDEGLIFIEEEVPEITDKMYLQIIAKCSNQVWVAIKPCDLEGCKEQILNKAIEIYKATENEEFFHDIRKIVLQNVEV